MSQPWDHTPEQRRDELLAACNRWRDEALFYKVTCRHYRLLVTELREEIKELRAE